MLLEARFGKEDFFSEDWPGIIANPVLGEDYYGDNSYDSSLFHVPNQLSTISLNINVNALNHQSEEEDSRDLGPLEEEKEEQEVQEKLE